MLLYITFLCQKIARAHGGRERDKPTKLGVGSRIGPNVFTSFAYVT